MSEQLRAVRTFVVVAIVALVAAVPVGSNGLAAATAGGGASSGVIWANVQFSSPPSSSGGSDASGCRWKPAVTHDAGIGSTSGITRVVGGVVQRLYERSCGGVTTLVWVSQPSAAQLGQAARDVVIGRLPAPIPRTAPPADRAVVLSALWFWTDPTVWREVSVTAWVPTPTGVAWSRTTARPTQLVFQPAAADSSMVSCVGPGRVWRLADGDDGASPCSVTYRHDSSLAPGRRFPATLGIDWTISWTSSSGRGGVLPGHRTTAAVPVTVSEIQALVSGSR